MERGRSRGLCERCLGSARAFIIPFTTSWKDPSPPTTQSASNSRRETPRARSEAWPAYSVRRTSNSISPACAAARGCMCQHTRPCTPETERQAAHLGLHPLNRGFDACLGTVGDHQSPLDRDTVRNITRKYVVRRARRSRRSLPHARSGACGGWPNKPLLPPHLAQDHAASRAMGNALVSGWSQLLGILGFGDKRATVILLGLWPMPPRTTPRSDARRTCRRPRQCREDDTSVPADAGRGGLAAAYRGGALRGSCAERARGSA